jgi:hypothetical protein
MSASSINERDRYGIASVVAVLTRLIARTRINRRQYGIR